MCGCLNSVNLFLILKIPNLNSKIPFNLKMIKMILKGFKHINQFTLHSILNNKLKSCRLLILVFVFGSYSLFAQSNHSKWLVDYVQPFSGTANATTISALKHSETSSETAGNTIPDVGLPFAMVNFTPQTRFFEQKCNAPYKYGDTLFSGIRATHWLSGSCTQDYGSLTIMGTSGHLELKNDVIMFKHNWETSTPYYYQMDIPDKYKVEVSGSLRSGIIVYTMNSDDSLFVHIHPNSDIGKGLVLAAGKKNIFFASNPAHRIYQGWGESAGFSGYFYLSFDKVPCRVVYDEDENSGFIEVGGSEQKRTVPRTNSGYKNTATDAYLGFYLRKGERLVLRIGNSFSSFQGAKRNLNVEIGKKSFETVRRAAKQEWETSLAQIKVSTKNEKLKHIFYTSLYHSMQQPRLFSDVDGYYPKFGGYYQLERLSKKDIESGKRYYDDFSMWDIYRAELPLYEILQPNFINQLVESLILKAQQGGWLPIFPCWNNYTGAMVGDHAVAFIASAYNKGIRDYNIVEAYKYMHKNSFEVADSADYHNGMGRRALNSYLKYGYIPLEDSVPVAFHKKEQVSRSMEYYYDDYALSTVAKSLGYQKDYEMLKRRSENYYKVFDKSVNSVRGRYISGKWISRFNPEARESFITEGTPHQLSFYVPQDVKGLIKLMGGQKRFMESLDKLFQSGGYWHGNEPGQQIPFMYNYTSQPYKTTVRVHRILNQEYSEGPGGLGGNDDGGQMSAWYVFASMGFYPVDPVSGRYLICAPLFDTVAIRPGLFITSLIKGKNANNLGDCFSIICHKSSPQACYIEKIELDGKPYAKNYFCHRFFQNVKGNNEPDSINRMGKAKKDSLGHRMDIWLVDKPTNWGSAIANQP